MQGTFHQYHTALLLLTELYATPERHYEDRIWDCLDYVFELSSGMERGDKGRLIFEEVVEKTQYYHSLRKVRAPKKLEEGLAQAAAWHEKMSRNASNASALTQQYCRPKQGDSRDPRDRINTPPAILSMEFRNYTFLPEEQYYAQQSGQMSQSPQSVEGTGTEISSNPAEASAPTATNGSTTTNRVDIDWVCMLPIYITQLITISMQNEWDKLFPPDANIPDLNPPDFNNNFPRGYGHTFHHPQSSM